MEETYLLDHPGVKKKILHGGQGPLPHFPKGTKLAFHFQTLLDNFERTVIDDSRKNKLPTEIFVGRMFKMEVWEVLLTSMRIGEVAEFWCDATHTGLYPMVSKGIRLAAQGKDPLDGQRHMCGMGNVFHYHSTGFPELDEIMRTPQPLIFIMELISVGDPFSYQRESWMMEKDEKLKVVPSLHLLGNALVKQGRFREAAVKYQEAVVLLRTVQSREMPGDEDYINLGRLIIPLVLNYCQCMLELEEYYEVIEHTTELLDKHKDCVKAYYKRAKAYAAVWSEREARKDFQMVANLDITLSRLVQRELDLLSERMKEKYWEDKERYWNIFGEKKERERESEEEEENSAMPTKEESKVEHSQSPEYAEEGINPSVAGENKHDTKSEDSAGEASRRITALTEGKDWQQMLRLILLLQDEGNFDVKEHKYTEATVKFKEALEYVDHLQTKVEHEGEDWESLEKVRLPLCLNLSQCKLELGEYQEVVDLNSKLLKKHKDNLKAMYQRARAHSALYNEDEARRDFTRVLQLDPTFKPIVKQEIKKMGEKIRVKCVNENKNYWTSTQEKLEKKAQVKRGKKTKKGVTWADESKIPEGNDEGHSGCSSKSEESCNVKAGNNDEGQDEKKKSENQRDERSLTLKESKAKTDNTAADRDGDSAQINVLGEGTQRSETDNDSKTLLTNDITKKNDGQDEITDEKQQSPEKSDKDASSGASREERLTDMTGDDETEESNTAAEFIKMEKTSVEEPSSAKPEKYTKKVKCKKKKK
ncbi:golgin subfamily A member 6-like protein 24 [Rhinichthys klamathensis goyatoka]|uniref:golgin subfamily A member 6-like protein 24 n=1 Tax=Rhinichthys klamathensis goyatoka TaxID=3034132 RepID=UPI0024B5F77B|nr:golgin subfamily A member 6-like protein 24 [Rhinichthys klamathensis goyatoka]